MSRGQLDTLIRHLRRVVRPPAASELSDAQLLERFVHVRDEAAFELLVWRHGAMVLNVCLRVLHCRHDAEDAFQATFLALVRKASTIGKRASVGSWLYKVAYRIALRAKSVVPTLSLPEEPLRDTSAKEPLADLLFRELRSALDEEINHLPDKYRVALVLCQLEGQTTEAAARALGCPPATVGTRLARARELLRRRLVRRGFALPALVMSGSVVAALPAALVNSTVKAGMLGTADKALAAGVISTHVAALTKGALQTMSLTKWTLTTMAVLALSLLGGGAAFLAHSAHALDPAPTRAASVALLPPDKERSVVFKWKFVKEKSFYQEVTTTTVQTMKVGGKDVIQNQQQTFYFTWTPTGQDRDGNWILKQRIEGVKVSLDIGGSKIEFDSTKEGAANNPLCEFYKGLVGSEFIFTLTKEYKVGKVEGRDEFIKKLSASNAALSPLFHPVLSDAAVRQAAEVFAFLREEPVRPGDSWKRKSKLDLGPIGEYETSYKYTYEGKEGPLEKIKVRSTVKDQAPGGRAAGMPFKSNKGELNCAEVKGTILFDREKGRIVCQELDLKLDGKLTIISGALETIVELSQTQKTTFKTKDPIQRYKPVGGANKEVERLREENQRLRRQLRAVEEALRRESKPKE